MQEEHNNNVINITPVNTTTTEMVIPKMPKSIATAISGVMGDIQTLKQDADNDFQKYKYASIDGFLGLCRPIMAKHGLIITMDEKNCVVERDAGKKPWLHIEYIFILSHSSGDTWGFTPMRNMFVEVSGGQSFGSSQSYVLKQFMRGLFQINTGEKDDLDGHDQSFDKPKKEQAQETNHKSDRRKG